MWWRTVLVFGLAIIDNISAQDDTNATETQTQMCCPCPPGWPGTLVSPVDPGSSPSSVDPVSHSAVGVDDCPCRARDADSEGAASVFFPNAVRAFGDVVRSDPKEDSKPLLHPEVGLAASVLETLREATDEEYRDALERDAARATADVASLTDVIADGVPEEAGKVVTIVVSPRDMDGSDDAMPEASHVQETRCIHSSLGNPRASVTYKAPVPRKGLDDILNLPLPTGLLHRQRDSSLAASNAQENIVKPDDNLNKILSGLRLKTEASLLTLDPKTISENVNNLLTGVTLGNKVGKSSLDDCEIDNSNARMESSNDLISSEVLEESVNIKATVLNDSDPTRQSGIQEDLDCNTSPTNEQETVSELSAKNAGPLKSLFFARNYKEKPQVAFPLKNLFQLKDVELVPLDILKNKPKTKINIPTIKLHPLSRTEAKEPTKLPTVLFGKPSKFTTENSEAYLNKLNKEKSANIQPIPKRKVVTTEILDAVPNPSDDNCVKLKPEADKSAGVNMEELEDSLLNPSTESVETDDEKASIGMQEVDTDVLGINSAENMQLKSSETLDEETSDTNDFQIIDDTQEPVQESDSEIQIISQEDISDVPPGSIDLSEVNEAKDRSNGIPETHHTLRRLEEIRKSVVDKLEALQKSNKNALDNIKHNVEDISTQVEERNQDTDFVQNEDSTVEATFEFPSATNPVEEELRDSCASAESISFQDLQKMSDSILMASENVEQRAEPTNGDSLESAENSSASKEISEGEISTVLGMDENETNPNNELDQSTDDSGSLKAACLSEFKKSDQNKLEKTKNIENKKSDDLEILASDPIMDILRPNSLTSEPIMNLLRPNSRSLVDHINDLGTKLRQSVVVQPSALINADDFNIFRMPSLNIPDVSSLNANLPTLEEIRTRVSEILDGLARSASDDDESSEIDSDDFASNVNPVLSTGASSSDPISILPPLEDINLDIIQLKPLPSLLGSSPLTPSLPGLNLNRYKAKLAIPKSLEIKPLNLASTLGTDGGLVGTTLTIGPEKNEKSSKAKFKPNKNSLFVKSSRVVTNNDPTLADITSTMHKNAMNLLNIPNSSKNPNLQASNIMDNLAEKIKSDTEETVRSIHKTLNPSTLADVHNNVLKNANNLLASGRNSLQKTLQPSTPIESVIDNLRSQTQNTFQQLHDTLHAPRVADLSSVIQKNTHSILKSPKNSIDTAVDSLRTQSENTFRNIQQTLDTAPLADLSDSIHKTAQNILKSSSAATPIRNILGSSMQIVPPIDKVAGNLRSHTQNALKTIQETLNTPALSDITTSIQQSAQHVLKSPLTNNRPEILKSALQPSVSLDTVVDNLRSQTQNTMRTIQNSINTPTLADISETVQKHAQNLLESPVALTGRDTFKQVLQASPPINLATHADQVAKDLQKTLKATLKNSPIKHLPPLPHPNDVLQIISDHHEDVNDKLYALHTDLNDRLESIHNEVTDPERLRSILSPSGNRNFELFAIPLPMNSRSVSSALNQERPVVKANQPSAKITQKKQPKKSSTAPKPRTEAARPNSMRPALRKESSLPKSFRIPSAASSQIPTRTDRPTLSLIPKKPLGLGDIKKPVLPKFKPLAKNKVTITFGSTSQRPDISKSRLLSTTAKPKVSTNKRFKPKGPIRQPTPWNGWSEARNAPKRLGDPFTAPSQMTPNARTPLKSKPAKPFSSPTKTGMSSRLAPVAPNFKSQSVSSKPHSKLSPPTQGRASIPRQPLAPNKPKSPLLTKLTDALKSKQTHALSQTPRPTAREMSPAASDRFEKVVAMDEPLKENVPYKCKMMCVKVDLNDE